MLMLHEQYLQRHCGGGATILGTPRLTLAPGALLREPPCKFTQQEYLAGADRFCQGTAAGGDGGDPNFGAGPLKRAIKRLVQDPLALKILHDEVRHGDHVIVDVDLGKMKFTTYHRYSHRRGVPFCAVN